MKNTDLHTHSHFSDGEYSPKELVKLAKKKRIKNLALTDHSSIKGVKEAIEQGRKSGINIIPATEVPFKHGEILGYFIDYKNKNLKKELLRAGYYMNKKTIRILKLLKKQGENISVSKFKRKFPYSKNNYNNAHLFYYLMSKGYKFEKAVQKVMNAKGKIKKPLRKNITGIQAIKLIKKYNGVPVLAHPWIKKKKFTEKNIKKYVKNGLKGIEYENGEEDKCGRDKKFLRKIKKIAKKYNLILTQGSDFHGPIMVKNLKRHKLGKYNCDERVVGELEKLSKNVHVTIKKGRELTKKEIKTIVDARLKEYGENDKEFEKEKDSIFFFVKDNEKIVSFGMLKPIKMHYLDKEYNILGIGNIMSLEKGKSYGKILIHSIIDYLKDKGKTGLGFCGEENVPFYEKAGLKSKNKFSWRFVLKNPKTGKETYDEDNCPGIYYNGKDDFINKVLLTKSIGYYWISNLREPHW